MIQDCWQLSEERGLLIQPDPIACLQDVLDPDFPVSPQVIAEIEGLARDLARLLDTRQVRKTLDDLPVYDFAALANYVPAYGFAVIERLHQIYAFFASASIYATHEAPARRIPAGVAVPLVQLSHLVQRPPILAYCGYVLNNWRRLDPDGPIALDNLALNQTFLGSRDEAWFVLTHVEVEARAARLLTGLRDAVQAARNEDAEGVMAGLAAINLGLHDIMRTFERITEGCDPDYYYRLVRPYNFGFSDVRYEGIEAFGEQPRMVRGQSGAQSSIIPALLSGLGIQHETSDLTRHLEVMRAYMPKPHRDFIAAMSASALRALVVWQGAGSPLAEAYNDCLETLMAFRRMHYHYVNLYIFQKVDNPLGTGGTPFMDWLHQLIGETERHRV